jgi:uncharacterized repeat protein (TIGR01451 family)
VTGTTGGAKNNTTSAVSSNESGAGGTASASLLVIAPPTPDLTITNTGPASAQQGQTNVTYTITVSNVGTAPTVGTVTMTDTLPAGLIFASATGSGWTINFAAGTVTATRSDALAAPGSYPQITLKVNVANNAPSSITDTATVSGGGETNTANDSASATTTIGTVAADLSITKTHSGAITAGRNLTYTITVSNAGPAAATSVSMTDPLPSGLTFVSLQAPAGWTCATPAAGGTGTVSCTLPTLANGGSGVFTLAVLVANMAPPTLTNIASVSSPTTDLNTANNSASDAGTVSLRRDPSQDPDVIGLLNAQVAAAERFANAQISNFNQRMESLHDDGYGSDRQGIMFGAAEPAQSPTMAYLPHTPAPAANSAVDQVFAKADPAPLTKAPPPASGRPGERRDYAFWSSGYVELGNTDNVSNLANAAPGSRLGFDTAGVTFGFDYRFGRYFTGGLGVGYGRDATVIGNNGTKSNAQTLNIGVYGSYHPIQHLFVDSVIGVGTLKFDSQRFVMDDGVFANGSRVGNEYFGSLTGGYEFHWRTLMLSPYGRVNAVSLMLGAFTETGDPMGALAFSGQSASTITGVLGLRGKYDFLMSWGVLSPSFRFEYNHAFQQSGQALLQFSDFLTGPAFGIIPVFNQSDYATVGAGTDLHFENGVFLNFDYQTALFLLSAQVHRFQVRVGKQF